MADQDFTHTAEIMKAALPYIDSKTRVFAELFTKVFDLMGTLNIFTGSNKMAACGFDGTKTDLEGLLTGIRPICNHKEREIVDRILNFFSMKKMFEMYNNMMSAMKTMQEFEGYSFGDSDNGNASDTVSRDFSGYNFESIFGNSNAPSDAYGNSNDNDNGIDYNSGIDNGNTDEPKQETSASGDTRSSPNTKMFEMLKTMVPPEQMSTFENLSMLFNAMSYDNNSKPDDHKEQNDA